ncbi:hypothetical protein Tco_0151984 [Tanacetum coccineum]
MIIVPLPRPSDAVCQSVKRSRKGFLLGNIGYLNFALHDDLIVRFLGSSPSQELEGWDGAPVELILGNGQKSERLYDLPRSYEQRISALMVLKVCLKSEMGHVYKLGRDVEKLVDVVYKLGSSFGEVFGIGVCRG